MSTDPGRCNILWILTDQHRRDCVGAFDPYGQVRTPHLDALAVEGVCLDRHYCSAPLCVPARASLATGRWPQSCGVTINGRFGAAGSADEPDTLDRGERTVGERLKEAGYRVGMSGVDHVATEPPKRQRAAFDFWYEREDYQKWRQDNDLPWFDASAHQAEVAESTEVGVRRMKFSSPAPGRHPLGAEQYADFVYADKAAAFLRQQPADEPWMLQVNLWAPHPPFVWPEPYDAMYEAGRVTLSPNVAIRSEGQTALHERHVAGQCGRAYDTREDWKPVWASYLGGCTLADAAIGRILEAARARADWDNTVVIFHSDHGEQLGSHRCFQKMVCYEESIHVPMIVRAPGASAGSRCGALTSHVDVAPTILDYAGLAPAEGMQGVSLRSVLESPGSESQRQAVFSAYSGSVGWGNVQRCVVTDRWKLIDNVGVDRELFDLEQDPHELRNRIDDAPAGVAAELEDRLLGWMRDAGDEV